MTESSMASKIAVVVSSALPVLGTAISIFHVNASLHASLVLWIATVMLLSGVVAQSPIKPLETIAGKQRRDAKDKREGQ